MLAGLLAAASGQLDVLLKKNVSTKAKGFTNGLSAGSPHRYANGKAPVNGIHSNGNSNGLHV